MKAHLSCGSLIGGDNLKLSGEFLVKLSNMKMHTKILSACLLPPRGMDFTSLKGAISTEKLRHAETEKSKRIQVRNRWTSFRFRL